MALSRSRPQDLPQDAVVLSRDEALTYQWKMITSWHDAKDVWCLRYSAGIIGGMAAITGAYVNSHYRRLLKLGEYGRISTYLPIVIIPAIFTTLTHKMFVQRELILDPMANCPLCLQMRAAAFQGGFGVVYPTLLAPLAAFMFATRHYTYRLPDVLKEPKAVFNLWRKFTRPLVPMLGIHFALQAIVAMCLTYKQTEESWHFQRRIQQMERQQQDGHEMVKELGY